MLRTVSFAGLRKTVSYITFTCTLIFIPASHPEVLQMQILQTQLQIKRKYASRTVKIAPHLVNLAVKQV